MIKRKEIIHRSFIGEVQDETEELHEVKVTLDEIVWEDGHTEHQNEDFEVNNEFVTYTDLVDRFGEAKINALIEEAIKNAR